MNINEQFEIALSSEITEGSTWLKYSDLLLAKIHAMETHGPKSAELKNLIRKSEKKWIKLEFQNKNLHTKTKANTNITPNTTMKKQNKSLQKNTQRTLSILDMNLENEKWKNL